jgi:hypothetical protein
MQKEYRTGYPSDVSDEEWAFVTPYLRCAVRMPRSESIL